MRPDRIFQQWILWLMSSKPLDLLEVETRDFSSVHGRGKRTSVSYADAATCPSPKVFPALQNSGHAWRAIKTSRLRWSSNVPPHIPKMLDDPPKTNEKNVVRIKSHTFSGGYMRTAEQCWPATASSFQSFIDFHFPVDCNNKALEGTYRSS